VLIRCPSCAFAFELAAESVGVKATTTCPACARVVVLRDAGVVPPGGDATMPLQAWTEVTLPPMTAEEQATKRTGLALPRGKRVGLAVMAGPGSGNLYLLDRPRVVIGRAGAGATIQLDDPEVSREHAALECRDGRVFLRDLGSRNGTFVDEREVKELALSDGSEYRLGRTRLMLMISEQR
jgi:pSer/pThr/pTyr-binding forkhead associated (FHA) protein